MKLRSLDNTAWIPFLQLNEAAYTALPYFPGQITGDMNRIINGALDIDQVNEGAGYPVPGNDTPSYTADQWVASCSPATAGGSPCNASAMRRRDSPVR